MAGKVTMNDDSQARSISKAEADAIIRKMEMRGAPQEPRKNHRTAVIVVLTLLAFAGSAGLPLVSQTAAKVRPCGLRFVGAFGS